MREMFLKSGGPLYRSTAHYPIGCITLEHWISFIKERFLLKGVSLKNSVIEEICLLTEGHPFYTQIICDILWDSCESGQEPDTMQAEEATSRRRACGKYQPDVLPYRRMSVKDPSARL